MPIPNNLSREHILGAAEQRNKGRLIPKRRNARTIALSIDGKKYPVKILISWGHEIATGQELNSNLFTSDDAVNCLRNLGFTDFVSP
ncbi:MAG: hypothetical protein EBU82_11255 [Flavobacteriia bacterium]|jgi:hypothetical protein|nr:hypothetical protein [Flavobacteriia bacterium]NBP28901.1 hypothetical protein [Flavobacteriia bacterium]